jgi:NAD+ synthase
MNLQKKIIKLLKVQPVIIAETEIHRRVEFLKQYLLQYYHLKSLIIAVSGGQDSTLTGKLCQKTIEEIRYKKKRYRISMYCIKIAIWRSKR